MSWTTPQQLRAQVQQLWNRGTLLATLVEDDQAFFPRRLVLKTPGSREMSERFGEVRDWIRALQGMRHLRLEVQAVRHPTLGHNELPASVWLDSLPQAAALLGRQQDVQQFVGLVEQTRQRHPALLDWLRQSPLKARELADIWPRLLAIVDWLLANPRPAIYLRQVDIPGVDSKFIEQHRGILTALLDRTLPAGSIDVEATGVAQFEQRYGFRARPLRIRFRLLDPKLALMPGSDQDITLNRNDFRALGSASTLQTALRRLFITENEVNFLSFPAMPDSLALFGAGYGFEALADIPWLAPLEVHYWGDIDTHGFAILDQLRTHLPQAKSLLMDSDTLLAHKSSWSREDRPQNRNLQRLSESEQALYRALCEHRQGDRVRLEQEKIGFGRLQAALADLD